MTCNSCPIGNYGRRCDSCAPGYIWNVNSSLCEPDLSRIVVTPATTTTVVPSPASSTAIPFSPGGSETIVQFDQDPISYVKLPTLRNSYQKFEIELSIKPESLDGVILFNGQDSESDSRDYVYLGLKDGYVEYKFELGGGPMTVSSESRIELNNWITIKISRHFKDGLLFVSNQGKTIGSTAPGKFVGLDLKGPLYIGSVPDFSIVTKVTGSSEGFKGCISLFKIGSRTYDLMKGSTIGVSTCTVNESLK